MNQSSNSRGLLRGEHAHCAFVLDQNEVMRRVFANQHHAVPVKKLETHDHRGSEYNEQRL